MFLVCVKISRSLASIGEDRLSLMWLENKRPCLLYLYSTTNSVILVKLFKLILA